jgi:hypothetical protein
MAIKKTAKKVVSKKITRIVGKTKVEKMNEECLKIIRAWRGSFG